MHIYILYYRPLYNSVEGPWPRKEAHALDVGFEVLSFAVGASKAVCFLTFSESQAVCWWTYEPLYSAAALAFKAFRPPTICARFSPAADHGPRGLNPPAHTSTLEKASSNVSCLPSKATARLTSSHPRASRLH